MNKTIIGHVCIDENQSEGTQYKTAGSPAMFMTKIFEKLGYLNSTIVSHYGSNYLKYLKNKKIFPTNPISDVTLTYQNISHGNKRFQKVINRDQSEPVNLTPKLSKIIKASDVLVIAPILPNYSPIYIKNILNHTNKKTLKILTPQGYCRNFEHDDTVIKREFKEASEIIPFMDIVIISIEDCINARKLAKHWANSNDLIVILTMGSKGCEVIVKNKSTIVKIQPVPESQIVDSIGSGDIFAASFIHKYLETRDEIKSAKYANNISRKMLFYSPKQIENLNSAEFIIN